MYKLPIYVTDALSILKSAGFEAYAVGGCVRDMLLLKNPDDYDITTSALPENIIKLFEHTVLTGVKHGTVTVIINNHSLEITTFRTDGKYINNRKPDSVTFLKNINGDLSRRDFTINAMAYDGDDKIIDLFGGKEDLNNKIIRAVGNPEKRFTEDALRILRAFRFAAKLGFEIEENTFAAIKNTAHLLKNISRERIFTEFSKILTSDNPELLEKLINCGGMDFLGVNHNIRLSGLNSLKNELPIRFFAFCKMAEISAEGLALILKTDNMLIKHLKSLDFLFSDYGELTKTGIKKMLFKTNEQIVADYLTLLCFFKNEKDYTPLLNDILESKEPYLIKDLAITGDDLKNAGLSGNQIGQKLESLLYAVMENPDLNKKEILLNL